MKSIYADFSLLLTAVIWGTGFVASQYALDSGMATSFILLIRFSVAALILFFILSKRILPLTSSELKGGFLAGIFLFLAFYAQTFGLQFTTPSNNAFITATNVIMVPFISWFFFKKKPRKIFFILPFITFIGVAFLTYSPTKGISFTKGDAFTLLCALFFAIHISFLDIIAKKIDPIKLTFLQMVTASILSTLYLFSIDNGNIGTYITWKSGLTWSIYLGIFSTLIAFLIQTSAQKYTASTKTAIFLSTESLFGALFSIILGLELFTPYMALGGTIILLSIFISEIRIPIRNKINKNI